MKNKFLHGAAALALCAGVVSCSEYDAGLSDTATNLTAQQEATIKEYTANFTARYGTIDPNHTWGFGEIGSIDEYGTRGATEPTNNGGKQIWWIGGDVVEAPPAITSAEEAKVVEAFKNCTLTETNITIDWNDYFVQQVHASHDIYKAKNNGDVDGSSKMNRFAAYDYNTGTYSHCGSFNAGQGNQYKDENGYGIALFTNMGSGNKTNDQFCYSNSNHSGNDYFRYIILEIDGSFYIGFDFYSNGQNSNEQVDADGVFTDWIIKIVPGKSLPVVKTAKRRVMCEDLGNTDDFDFNDVVFDVYYEGTDNAYTAYITVQAVGGTLPVFIGEQELHELYDQTAQNGKYVPILGVDNPKQITISTTTTNPNNIDICVGGSGSAETTIVLPKSGNSSAAPQKICVPVTIEWPAEREQIEDKYQGFGDWVQDQTKTDWWTKPNSWEELK